MSAYQRRKGHDWEREVASMLREAMPGARIRRGDQGAGGTGRPDVEAPHLHVECKCGPKPNARAAVKQAIADAEKGLWRVAVIRDDHDLRWAAMPLEDLLDLLAENWEQSNG